MKALAAAWLLTIIAVGLVGWKGRPGQPETLRVRQVTVIDDKGTERVWIGAPVPNPIVQGQRVERAGAVSGIILLDAHGNERSGYVTSDLSGEVFLSLDAAGPEGVSASSEAWRFWQGESPCEGRIDRPLLPSVAAGDAGCVWCARLKVGR